MATVTGGGFTNVVNVGSNDANGIATALAANLSAALGAGTFTRTAPNNSPSVGGGVPTIFTSGSYTLAPANLGLVVQDGLSATVTGSGGINEGILIGNSSVTFNTNGGSGVLVSGDFGPDGQHRHRRLRRLRDLHGQRQRHDQRRLGRQHRFGGRRVEHHQHRRRSRRRHLAGQ